MRLKLKEVPREWRKFTLVWTIFPALLIGYLYYQGKIQSVKIPAIILPLFFALGLSFPASMRVPYRVIMTGSFYVGQLLAPVMLTLFYVLMLTPLALLLRLMGKDLLLIKKTPRESYWEKAPPESAHDRMF